MRCCQSSNDRSGAQAGKSAADLLEGKQHRHHMHVHGQLPLPYPPCAPERWAQASGRVMRRPPRKCGKYMVRTNRMRRRHTRSREQQLPGPAAAERRR
eukprot:354141-Chlamydomonas_euryale.AAC.5